ncbi:MAG: hypothetical protein M1438_20570 [Deltaproteobacteria bacterium]|nr:hypothetical protein [Deltaproteobacteria bacterium]
MTNRKLQDGRIDQKPSSVETSQIDCQFLPQARGNRLQLISRGLAALAERVKLLQGTFNVRGPIGGGNEINLDICKDAGGLSQ